jgi:hypothetical protein
MPPDEPDPSDALLVRRVLDGDTAAFTSLFLRHYASVREFAYRVLLESHAADDVAQENFIRVARASSARFGMGRPMSRGSFELLRTWHDRTCDQDARTSANSSWPRPPIPEKLLQPTTRTHAARFSSCKLSRRSSAKKGWCGRPTLEVRRHLETVFMKTASLETITSSLTFAAP